MIVIDLLKWMQVSGACIIGDVCWAHYTRAIALHDRLKASLWAGAIMVVAPVVVISYTEDHILIIPAVLGAFAGTWISFKDK
jgi:hypothetical protein